MPLFLDRETYEGFLADSVDQQAKLTLEDINSPKRNRLPNLTDDSRTLERYGGDPPLEPIPPRRIDDPLAIDRFASSPIDAEPEPVRRGPAVPDFNSFLAGAGLGAPVAPAAPTPPAAPPPGGPPSFDSLLQSAGINVGQAASNLGTAARGVVDNTRPPSLDDLMARAGMLAPAPAPAAAAQDNHVHSLPHGEEPGTVSDMVDVNGKWKTQFDFGAIYTGNYRTGTPHRGIDIVPHKGGIGTPIEAFHPGTVTQISRDNGAGGLMVYVRDDQGLTHTYMHLAGTAPGLGVGQRVARGTPIALMGESGTEGSPHLHYEVRKNAGSGDPLNELIDPRPYMRGQGSAGVATSPDRVAPDRARVPVVGQTTAELSGGADRPQTGDRRSWLMGEGASAAAWLGEQGQKALQAILVTEGGMNNARGDSGQSAGPLQFYAGGGQLNNLMQQTGMTAQAAMQWVEDNPVAAIKWAIGTPDKPGYLGRAIAQGLGQGLSGADLATYAQRTGQVSVSPERAGANFNALFGGGGGLVGNVVGGAAAAAAARGAELTAQGQALIDGMKRPATEQESALAAQQRRTTAELQQIDQERAQAGQRRALFEQQSQAAADGPMRELRMSMLTPSEPVVTPPVADTNKPVWSQIGDTIGGAIAQGLQPIVEMLQGQPATSLVGPAPLAGAQRVVDANTSAFGRASDLLGTQIQAGLSPLTGALAGTPERNLLTPVRDNPVLGPLAEGVSGRLGEVMPKSYEEFTSRITTPETAPGGFPLGPGMAGLGTAASALGTGVKLTTDIGNEISPFVAGGRVHAGEDYLLWQDPEYRTVMESVGITPDMPPGDQAMAWANMPESLRAQAQARVQEIRSRGPEVASRAAWEPGAKREEKETAYSIMGGLAGAALAPQGLASGAPRVAAALAVDPGGAAFMLPDLLGPAARAAGRIPGLPSAPPLGRANIVEQGANYIPGTPEARVEDIMRARAAQSPDKLAHIGGQELLDEFRALNAGKAGPFTTDPAVAKGGTNVLLNSGGMPGTDDVRALADAGMVHKDWYSQFATRAAEIVGEENLAEFFTLFAITSSQTKVKRNVWETFNTMQKVRETAANAIAKGLDVETEIVKLINDKGRLSLAGKTANQKRSQILNAYLTGISEVKSGAKTSSYAGDLQSAGQKLYDPRTTNDVWVWRGFNVSDFEKAVIRDGKEQIDRPWESAVASSDPAYRFTEAILNEIAREKGLQGHQIQAAMWAAINSMSTQAPDLFKRYQAGDFQGAIRELNRRGLVAPDEAYSANVFDSDAIKQVLQGANRLREAGPLKATDMTRLYRGKGKTPRPSGTEFRLGERTWAESRAAMAETPMGPRELEAAGLDPETRTFTWLTQPHRVQLTQSGALIHLPGGNSDTARYVGAEVAQRAGVDEFTVHAPMSDATDTLGLSLIGSEDEIAALADELAEAGIGAVTATTGKALQIPLSTNAANAIGLRDSVMLASHIMQVADGLGIPAERIIKYAGRSERVGAESFERVLGELGGTFGGAGRSGVPAGPSGVPGSSPAAAPLIPSLPTTPPGAARQLAARTAAGATAGAVGAAQEEDASLEDILRGGAQGGLLAGGRAALGRAGIRAPMRAAARVAAVGDDAASGPTMGGGTTGISQSPTFLRESLRRMYPGAINKAAAKEAVQNSVDASRGIPGATTTVSVDNAEKTISIVDQGKGMTPQTMEDVFVKLGGSSKSAGSAGGMGTAIKAIMANAEDTWVRTIGSDPANPGRFTDSVMHGSGDDFLNGTMHRYYAPLGEMPDSELQGAPLEVLQLHGANENITGTAIWTKPMSDVNWDAYTLNSWVSNFNRSSRVADQNVEFVVDGRMIDSDTQLSYNGSPRAIAENEKPTQLLKTIVTPGAEIDFYGSSATNETGYAEIKLLNNGQYQADQFVQLPGNAKLPMTLVADVRSTVDPKGVGYPWTADRNSLIDTAQRAIKDYVGDELARDLISQENARIGDSIRNAPQIGMVKLVDDAGIADSFAAETLAAIPKHRGYRNLANLTNDLHESLIAQLEGRTIPSPSGSGTIGASHLVGLGVSNKWLGLNVPPSYTPWHGSGDEAKGILIEPWQIWKEVERAWPNASRDEQISRFTDGLLGTMLHEISHNTEIGGHAEGFAGLLTRIPQFLGSRQQQAITNELRKSLTKTWDTLGDDLARDADTFYLAARESQLERYGTSAGGGAQSGRPAVAADSPALYDQGGPGGGRRPGGAALPPDSPAEGRPPQALAGLLPTTPPRGARELAGRTAAGASAGAVGAAQDEDAQPEDILRGALQGSLLGGGRAALQRAGLRGPARTAARIIAPQPGGERVYHGGAGAFDRPDPKRFDEHGLYGPSYYLTSDERISGGIVSSGAPAEIIGTIEDEIARLRPLEPEKADQLQAELERLRTTRDAVVEREGYAQKRAPAGDADALEARLARERTKLENRLNDPSYLAKMGRDWIEQQQNFVIPNLEEQLARLTASGPNLRAVNLPPVTTQAAAATPIFSGTPQAKTLALELDRAYGKSRDAFWQHGADSPEARASDQAVKDAENAYEAAKQEFEARPPAATVERTEDTLNLFDADIPTELDAEALEGVLGRRNFEEFSDLLADSWVVADQEEPPLGSEVYEMLAEVVGGKRAANEVLNDLGFDGIRYAGGNRIPMRDLDDKPISHDAYAIFPEALDKLQNAVSGARGGLLEDMAGPKAERQVLGRVAAGATAGGVGAAQEEGASPEDVLRGTLQGGLLGAGRAALNRAGIRAPAAARTVARAAVGGAAPSPGAVTPPPSAVPDREFNLDRLAQMRKAQYAGPPNPATLKAPGKADHIVAYTIGNMLSGTGSAIQNTIGGVMNNVYRPIETLGAGRPTDALRDVAAQMNALGEAFSKYGHTFKTGERTTQSTTETTPLMLRGGWANPLNAVLRNLAATDEFMGALATAGEMASETSRLMRRNKKLSFDEVVQQNREAIIEAGARARRDATFTGGGGPLGSLGERMATWRSELLSSDDKGEKGLGVALTILVPMSRVPGVILGKGVRMLPVVNEVTGAIEFVNLARQGRSAEARRALSRTYLTSAANMAVLDQVYKGNITGNGPESDSERARLMEAVDAEGNAVWRPNSIKIGGRWFDHSGLGPISFTMGSIANAVDAIREYDEKPEIERGPNRANDLASALLKRQAQTVSHSWYLRNVADLLGAVKDGNVAAIGTQIAAGGDRLIPMGGLLNEIRRIEDPLAREPSKELGRNLLEREMNRLPGASRMVPPRLAATTGKPVEQPRDIFSTLVRGTPSGSMTPNPVAAEVARLNGTGNSVSVPREDDTYKEARQSPEQTRSIQEKVGQAVNMYVLDTMSKEAYAKLTDEQKADALKKAVGQARSAADITLNNTVARSPHESALLQWAQTPQYHGISSTLAPEEVARQNWEIQQAKSKLREYRAEYGEQGENRLRKDDPAAYKLSQREALEKETIDARKRKIDQATGGALTEAEKKAAAGGLVGVGSTTLPAKPPQR